MSLELDSLSHRPSHCPSEPGLDSPETAESRHARTIRQLAGGDDPTERRDMSDGTNVSIQLAGKEPAVREAKSGHRAGFFLFLTSSAPIAQPSGVRRTVRTASAGTPCRRL